MREGLAVGGAEGLGFFVWIGSVFVCRHRGCLWQSE